MLVLYRKAGQGIFIGDDIYLNVEQIETDRNSNQPKVKLTFQAPKHVKIDRSEVRMQKRKNNQA